jgi:hypothetical protein
MGIAAFDICGSCNAVSRKFWDKGREAMKIALAMVAKMKEK